jgi:hypothetical protein
VTAPDQLEPSGHTAFCDDIRFEKSEQYSLIGIYNSGMQVHSSFPAVISKFVCSVTFDEPTDLAFKRDFPAILNIYLPGALEPTSFEIPPAPRDVLEALRRDYLKFREMVGEDVPGLPDARVTALINVTMSPMILPKPGMIRVRISYGDKIINCGTFKVMAVPNAAHDNASQPNAN